MGALIEVLVRDETDARRAEQGGADRLMVIGSTAGQYGAPEPGTVERIGRATALPLRPLVRLREGYGTDGGEVTRMIGLVSSYFSGGAEGVVLGFLNGLGDLDLEVLEVLLEAASPPWTLDGAVDSCLDVDRALSEAVRLPGLDQIMTAGSPRGMDEGLDALLIRCRATAGLAQLVLAGAGLRARHVPWLVRAGVRCFHLAGQVREEGRLTRPVDPQLVRSWRLLTDSSVEHVRSAAPRS